MIRCLCTLSVPSFVLCASTVFAQGATWSISPRTMVLAAGDDELFQSVQFGRLLPDGGAVIADSKGQFLRVYSADGTRLAALGRTGAGPREFRWISGLWLTPQNTIAVWDGRLHRITTFDTHGSLLSTHKVVLDANVPPGNLELFLGTFANGDLLLGALRAERPGPQGSIPEKWGLGRFAGDGTFKSRLGDIRGMWRQQYGPIPFTPVPRIAIIGDSIYVAEGFDAQIKVLAPNGAIARTIPFPWRSRPQQNPWDVVQAEVERRKDQLKLQNLRNASRADPFPAIGAILADERANLWVKEYDPTRDALYLHAANALTIAPGGTYRVLNRAGRLIATVRMPDSLLPLDLRGDRVLAVQRDEFDVESVVVRTIVR